MREDFCILHSENGGPLEFSAVMPSNEQLEIIFTAGKREVEYAAVKAEVNETVVSRDVRLSERAAGEFVLNVDLSVAPSYGDGFENLYEVGITINAFHSENSGSVRFIYDAGQRRVSSISINGKMMSEMEEMAWRAGSKVRSRISPLDELLTELEALPGLDAVKTEIRSSINMNRLQQLRRERGFSSIDMSMHMVFTGNPGTGKTTLARLLAKIYKEAGILSRGQFVEADRSTLVSHYIGGTAQKVQRVVDSAKGGILFIDEAYSLADGQDSKDYGHEAITTLLKKMEDERRDLIVIVAGYPDKMNAFLNSNPGFRSRFNRFIEFRDYTADELTDIFDYICGKYGLVPEPGMKELLRVYFQRLLLGRDPYFANGRTARNIFEETLVGQANRLSSRTEIADQELMQLKVSDLPEKVRCDAVRRDTAPGGRRKRAGTGCA